MTTFIQSVTVFTMAALIISLGLTLLGKVPARMFLLTAIGISSLLVIGGLMRGDLFTVLLQSLAFVSWVGIYIGRRVDAHRSARQ